MLTYPQQYASSVYTSTPRGVSYIYFKGQAPPEAVAAVDRSPVNVILVDGQSKNAFDWPAQADQIVQWLETQGYTSFQVGFDDVESMEVLVGNVSKPPTLPSALKNPRKTNA